MSEPSFVILPVSGNSTQPSDQETAEIASTVHQALHKRNNPQPEQTGPLSQMLATHQDSLYKYISWENPTHTLAIYVTALGVLFGVHYLPLTQWALKAGMVTLGLVSVTELASRPFNATSLGTRLRPKEYKTFPELTLNATLKDIHDFVQYAIVQAQKIVFGQDLNKTFACFFGCTALFWLIKIVPAFWMTVIGLTSIFIAPLGFSQLGRDAARDVSARAQDMVNATTEKSKVLAQNGMNKASDLSSQAKQTATDLSAQARGTTANTSGTTNETNRRLQTSTETANKESDNVGLSFGNGNRFNSTSYSSGTNEPYQRAVPDIYAGKQLESDFAGKQLESDFARNATPPLPTKDGSRRTDSVFGTGFNTVSATHDNLQAPRGGNHEATTQY